MAHYYSKKQDSELILSSLNYEIFGEDFKFDVAGGVFSKDKLDKGTEVLILHAEVPEKTKFLDLG